MVNNGVINLDVEEEVPLKGGSAGGVLKFELDTDAHITRDKANQLYADTVARTTVRCGLLILTWYILSTVLGMYNKILVGKKHGLFGNGGFPAPLLLTGLQFAFQHMLARVVFATRLMQRTAPPLSWTDWSKLVLPNGTVTGLDIGFSNASLVHITMSFYTMCKSTTPIFLLGFAFLWGLETPSWSLAGVVAVIVSGLLLLVQGEADFDATGFVLVMSASCMSGLRFTLTQLLLHGKAGHEHGPMPFGGPLEILEVLTPVMSATTLLLSLATEQLWHTLPSSPYFSSVEHVLLTIVLIFFGAVLAFLMVWTEYQVIKETSALTFMIAGTVKEVVTVITAVIVFGDKFGLVNGVGLLIVIAGVLLFNWYKLHKLKQAMRQRVISREGSIDLLAHGAAGHVAAEATGSNKAVGARFSNGAGPVLAPAGLLGAVSSPRTTSIGHAGVHDRLTFSKRTSSIDEAEAEQVMKALEFEPLLPLRV